MSTTVKQTNEGVEVQMQGDVKKADIEAMVQQCQEGACACSQSFMQKVSHIALSGEDKDVTIKLFSTSLQKEEIEAGMKQCECNV